MLLILAMFFMFGAFMVSAFVEDRDDRTLFVMTFIVVMAILLSMHFYSLGYDCALLETSN